MPKVKKIETEFGVYHLRHLTQRQRMELADMHKADPIKAVYLFFVYAICDDQGGRCIGEQDVLDMPGVLFDQLLAEIQAMNGMNNASIEDAKKN